MDSQNYTSQVRKSSSPEEPIHRFAGRVPEGVEGLVIPDPDKEGFLLQCRIEDVFYHPETYTFVYVVNL